MLLHLTVFFPVEVRDCRIIQRCLNNKCFNLVPLWTTISTITIIDESRWNLSIVDFDKAHVEICSLLVTNILIYRSVLGGHTVGGSAILKNECGIT